MLIKAHPTLYAGVTFRSRLEATWAAFFDLSGIRWDYEPIDLEGWVPDFVLWVASPVYVEVKPAPLIPFSKTCKSLKVDSKFQGFEKAKRHRKENWVLLLGVRPNDESYACGLGCLMDSDCDGRWLDVYHSLCVENAPARWNAAKTLTQWVPA